MAHRSWNAMLYSVCHPSHLRTENCNRRAEKINFSCIPSFRSRFGLIFATETRRLNPISRSIDSKLLIIRDVWKRYLRVYILKDTFSHYRNSYQILRILQYVNFMEERVLTSLLIRLPCPFSRDVINIIVFVSTSQKVPIFSRPVVTKDCFKLNVPNGRLFFFWNFPLKGNCCCSSSNIVLYILCIAFQKYIQSSKNFISKRSILEFIVFWTLNTR